MQMESLIQEELLELFDSASARGRFATHWREGASNGELEVSGVGPIPFPVSKATVRALRSVARPARFGRGEETVLDRRVRDTWVIAKSRVKTGRRWRQTLGSALDRVHEALELPQGTRLAARLHDMLVYEEGQFFLAHRDAEKTPDMIGTLVVLLPSSFQGGASVIAHEGEKLVVRGSSSKELTFLAFFSDCEHEVEPVKKGHRVALTYELRLEGTPATEEADPRTAGELRELVHDHFATAVSVGWREEALPDRLVYLLDHQYTPRGLSWRRLKGADASRAAMLRQVAAQTDCEVRLATAEVHEQWSCEPEGFGYGRRGYRRSWDRDASPDESDDHPPLTELHDSDIVLDDWVDGSDRPTGDEASRVEPAELCFSRPSDELAPFRFEHEGYMGNWGDTVDRWYHRAAVVLWPRARDFVIRGKHDAAWGAARVRERAAAESAERAREMARELLPHWPRAVRASKAPIAADVLHGAHGLEDAELAEAWTAPLALDGVAVPDALAPLIQRYGADWLEERFEVWARGGGPWGAPRAIWQRSLPQLTKALPLSEKTVRLWIGRRLEAEHQALTTAVAKAIDHRTPSYARSALEALTDPFVAVLRAAALARAHRVRRAMVRELVGAASRDDSRDWAVAVLRLVRAEMSVDELEKASLGQAAEALRRSLDEALAIAPRGADDWSIDVALGCKCELCVKLRRFLSSRKERALNWPLAKHGRQHVHGQLDTHELPVTHTTRRQGRPYTLMLRKSAELFRREGEARAQMQKDLAWLARWPGRAAPKTHSVEAPT